MYTTKYNDGQILLTSVANAQSFCWDQLEEDFIVF